MSEPNRSDDVRVEPTTSRTSGRSARLAAVAVVVVLGSVIYVGATGAPATAPHASGSPPPALAIGPATPQPSSEPTLNRPSLIVPTPRPEYASGPVVPIVDYSKAPQYQYLGMALLVGDQEVAAPMSEVSPGIFSGGYRIRLPALATSATLRLRAAQSTISHDSFAPIGQWRIGLVPTGRKLDRNVVLTTTQAPSAPDTPDPLAARVIGQGFRITGRLDVQAGVEVLTIEVALAQGSSAASPNP